MPFLFSILLLAMIKFLLYGTRQIIKPSVDKIKSEQSKEKLQGYFLLLSFCCVGPIIISIFPLVVFEGPSFFLGFFNEGIRNYHLSLSGVFKHQVFTLYLMILPIFVYQSFKCLYISKNRKGKYLIDKIKNDEQLTTNEKEKICDLIKLGFKN